MLLFPNLYLSIFSFIWYDYGDLFIRPVRTIEKICARLVRDTPFIQSAVKSGSQVLTLVRWMISLINVCDNHIANWEIFPQFCPYWSWCPMTNQILIWNNDPSTFPNHASKTSPWSTRLTWPAAETFPLTAHAPRKRSIASFVRIDFLLFVCRLIILLVLMAECFVYYLNGRVFVCRCQTSGCLSRPALPRMMTPIARASSAPWAHR